MTTRFDAIIIGTGQSGPPLAARLADIVMGEGVGVELNFEFAHTSYNDNEVVTGNLPLKESS